MPLLVSYFLLLSLAIVFAGSYLAKYADRLGALLGLGGSMAGVVLLAIATSLPELVVGCHAVLIEARDLAVGDLLGSCLFNLLILAVLDLAHRSRGRMLSRTAAAHALSATSSILLTAIVLLFLLVNAQWTFARLGIGSLAILATYLLCLRLIHVDQQQAVKSVESKPTDPAPVSISFRHAAIGYAVATSVIFLAAPALAHTADQLSELTGLGGTFVGTVFLALVTSLPEVATTRAAVRMGAYDMAVGNILGSNAFNIAAVVGLDLFYSGSLLSAVSDTHAVTAASVIIVTAIATLGMLYRAEKRYWVLEPDAVLVILMIAGAFALVYFS